MGGLPVRFPISPLLEQADGSCDTLAEICDVNVGTVRQWKIRGISYTDADRLAIAVGSHPLILWPDYHEQVTDAWCAKCEPPPDALVGERHGRPWWWKTGKCRCVDCRLAFVACETRPTARGAPR